MPSFPTYRPRRLRRTEALRTIIRETRLAPEQLVLPLFVRSGRGLRQSVHSMPGVCQTSVDEMLRDAEEAQRLGIGGVLLFGIPDVKDAVGSSAWDEHGPVQEAVRALKREAPRLVVITDVCMCEYTDHGHCGVLKDGHVDNDATLDLLAKEALSHARAGADVVAPSDMMDLGSGRGVDMHGEEAAYQKHSRMFSPMARPALATETRGQNSALHLTGEFQPQKIGLMEARFSTPHSLSPEQFGEHYSSLVNEASVENHKQSIRASYANKE